MKTIGEILADPPRMGETPEFVKEVQEKIRKLDKIDRRESFARCEHCPDEANYHKESELFWDDEYGYLCEKCLADVEREREELEEQERLAKEEAINHYK